MRSIFYFQNFSNFFKKSIDIIHPRVYNRNIKGGYPKERISEMNKAMYDGDITFNVVKNLCDQLSKLTGHKYGILNKRVIIFADGSFKDAWANS